jgi:thiamine pyrophosphate-dependent acetolactate synthase large subunit-like protein
LRDALPLGTIVVADMTMLGYASARYFPVYGPRTFIHPVEFCAIGCGLPLAIGAKAAAPERPVVVLCGEGGFLLNVGELATVVQEKLDVIIIVFNDFAFTAVKKAQRQRFGGRYFATDLVVPDFVALARAFGLRGVQARDQSELQYVVSTAIQDGGATLIEVPLPAWQWYSTR